MGSGYYYDEHLKAPFFIVFRYAGTVWPLVLPYCFINILLLTALTILKEYYDISLSILPQGHALMSLLITYLGVSKVNLAYERYMSAQITAGHVFMILRELNQLGITLTEPFDSAAANEWRRDTKQTIIQLIHETVATLRDGRHAAALARNVGDRSGIEPVTSMTLGKTKDAVVGLDDPMVLVHALRTHLYHESNSTCRIEKGGVVALELQLFERVKMIDLLHDYTTSYRDLVRLASSPLPFALVQMGRTFIFIWTLTIPFVLSGKDFVQDYPSSFSFVILLTYGFLGLEFVFRMLSNPFGDEIKNDLNIRGMGTAAVIGIEEDSELSKKELNKKRRMNDGNNRVASHSLRDLVQQRQESILMSNRSIVSVEDGSNDVIGGRSNTRYRTMGDDTEMQPATSFLT